MGDGVSGSPFVLPPDGAAAASVRASLKAMQLSRMSAEARLGDAELARAAAARSARSAAAAVVGSVPGSAAVDALIAAAHAPSPELHRATSAYAHARAFSPVAAGPVSYPKVPPYRDPRLGGSPRLAPSSPAAAKLSASPASRRVLAWG